MSDCQKPNAERPTPALFRSSDAAEIAEAALVLPLVFMFLLGIVWFGRAFNIYSTIQQAAQQGAITAARETQGTVAYPTPASVATVVESVLGASSLGTAACSGSPQSNCIIADTPTVTPCPVAQYPPPTNGTCPPASDNITVCYNIQLNTQTPPNPNATPLCGTLVVFQYPFSFFLPFTSLNMQQITLTAQAQSRMEN
jgi:Flp pilus assembly protein TadG